jgi:hypothetical protein
VCAAAVLKKIPVELGSGKTRVSNIMHMLLKSRILVCVGDADQLNSACIWLFM